MTRGVVGRSSRRREARIRISIDKEHRIEDFERNFVVEKEKKNYRAFRSLRVYTPPLLLRSSLVPATILLHCPRKFARLRSIINHASSLPPPSFVPLADIARSIHSDGV